MMPTYRSSPLVFILTILLALSSSVSATRRNKKTDRVPKTDLKGYKVPLSNGTMNLPDPDGPLKAITLGLGTQNYTCNVTTPAPVLVGAVATLLDLSPLLPLIPADEGMKVLEILPAYLLNFDYETILSFAMPVLGDHFFDGEGIPTFKLGELGHLEGKKVPGADLVAPMGASPGQEGEGVGAINWLKLGDAGGSKGVSQGYRVQTAGGKAPVKCEKEGDFEVPYAALYWFFK
ncbi:MAG: hypothetical protein Q9164_001248 [Protoblastenia rupestris]